ncbi:hypothetical protein C0995_010897 [Termitomyces sp. Mi166|nr:hypothetical protein C0995_010897 [Termitomyces sp. Mi166\
MTTFLVLIHFKGSFIVLGHEVAKSLAKINACMSSLVTLQAGFIFPNRIDITDPRRNSTKEPLDLLPHTKHNKSLLRYVMALHDLRVELGTVETFHDPNVLKARSLAIGRVEEALQNVADEVGKRIQRPQLSRSKIEPAARSRTEKPHHIQFMDVTTHVPNSLPVPPLPSREVCRQIGDSSKFVKAFKEMAHKTTALQIDRLKAVARKNTTSRWDRELVELSKRWNHQVDQALRDVQRAHDSRRHRLS